MALRHAHKDMHQDLREKTVPGGMKLAAAVRDQIIMATPQAQLADREIPPPPQVGHAQHRSRSRPLFLPTASTCLTVSVHAVLRAINGGSVCAIPQYALPRA